MTAFYDRIIPWERWHNAGWRYIQPSSSLQIVFRDFSHGSFRDSPEFFQVLVSRFFFCQVSTYDFSRGSIIYPLTSDQIHEGISGDIRKRNAGWWTLVETPRGNNGGNNNGIFGKFSERNTSEIEWCCKCDGKDYIWLRFMFESSF